MKRITSKEVTSMMEAVAQVYEQPEAEQLDEVSLNPMSSADVRAKAIERMRAQGMTQAQIDKAFAAMDKSAEEKAADAKAAREKRDRQAPGGLGTDGRSGALGQLIRTIQKTGVTGDEGAQAARDYDAAAKILLKDPKNRGLRGELTASTEDIRNEIQRIRDARFAKKPETETETETKPAETKPKSSVPAGSFNISPEGSDRRNEVEAQIKRDNAARTDDQRVQSKPKPQQSPSSNLKSGSPNETKDGTKFERRLPTSAELRAAQQARKDAPKVLSRGEIENRAIKAAVGVSKGTVKDPKIAADANRKAELERIRQRAASQTRSGVRPTVASTADPKTPPSDAAAKPASTPAARPSTAQVRGRKAMMAAQRNRAATPAVKAPATAAAKPAGSIAQRLQAIRNMRAASQSSIAAQGGTPATPAANPTPKATPPSTTGATTTPTVKPVSTTPTAQVRGREAMTARQKNPRNRNTQLNQGDPMERMTGKGAASLLEAYSKVYEEREPQAIDEGITSVVKDPRDKAKGPSPTSKGSRTKLGPGEGGRFPEKKKPEKPPYKGPRVKEDGPGFRKPPYQLPKRTPENAKNVEYYKDDVDLFDIIKGHLMSEGLTEEEALKAMLALTDEERSAILEDVGIVGPPKKAIDKIPGVRNARIGLANAVKRLDYGYNDEIRQVGKHVVPTGRTNRKFDRPGFMFKDISGDK